MAIKNSFTSFTLDFKVTLSPGSCSMALQSFQVDGTRLQRLQAFRLSL